MDTFNGNINLHNKTIFLTGAAGFIVANLAVRLLAGFSDIQLVGIDNMNDYYDVKLKEYRLSQLSSKSNFTYVDDIVEGVVRVMQKAPEKKNGEDGLPIPPYKVYNIEKMITQERMREIEGVVETREDKKLNIAMFGAGPGDIIGAKIGKQEDDFLTGSICPKLME